MQVIKKIFVNINKIIIITLCDLKMRLFIILLEQSQLLKWYVSIWNAIENESYR